MAKKQQSVNMQTIFFKPYNPVALFRVQSVYSNKIDARLILCMPEPEWGREREKFVGLILTVNKMPYRKNLFSLIT